jgi:hypothetical protein
MHVYKGINNKPVHIFQLQKSIIYVWCIYVVIFFYRCFFLQVDNLNLATNLENYFLNVILMTCKKCMARYKRLNRDAKVSHPIL